MLRITIYAFTLLSFNLFAAIEINGTIIAKQGELVQVNYQSTQNTAPQVNDSVKFSSMMSGIPINCGNGIVTKVSQDSVWIKPEKNNLKIKMKAVIQATGKPIQKKPKPKKTQVNSANNQEPTKPKFKTWTEPSSQMEFIYIAKGCFQMGSPTSELFHQDDEEPRHQVCLDAFWISKYEVNNLQFRQYQPNHNSESYKGHTLNKDKQPVVMISWEKAVKYTKWLSKKAGKNITLPTEAQWEYAARGNTQTPYFWGSSSRIACQFDNIKDLTAQSIVFASNKPINCSDNHVVTAEVGNFKPNPFGLYDMLGNASEWCLDWYDKGYYQKSPINNPSNQNMSRPIFRVTRGGNWLNTKKRIRSAHRGYFLPNIDQDAKGIGFRIVMSENI